MGRKRKKSSLFTSSPPPRNPSPLTTSSLPKRPHNPSPPPPQSSTPPPKKRPTFASYLETPNLSPKIKLLCEIIATVPSSDVEKSLEDTGVRVTTIDVEQVLKLSYGFPGPSVKFFRWAGVKQLNDKHSPYGWNLVVDLLGKNLLFDAMWDAIKSMKNEGLLSLATFASVFSSYVIADRVDEAIMTFEVMDQYGCPRDVVALNSLLSAICREKKTAKAWDFLRTARDKIRPDRDTYAILLEGWESEGDAVNAHKTFGEMVILFGWDPLNVPAYDAFLNTLLKGQDGVYESMKFFQVLKSNMCFPGMKFFRSAMDELMKHHRNAEICSLWESMVRINGCNPDTLMYNNMINLQCYLERTDLALYFLDEMVFHGAFPDANTYNTMLEFLLKMKKPREIIVIFNEMIKNEFIPTRKNCITAITLFIHLGDPDIALKVWKCMIENKMKDLEDIVNPLIVGLRDHNRVPEACKYAEDAIERGIKLNSSTLSKLKQSLTQSGKAYAYEELLKKWKLKAQ